eukprot:GFYU01028473.1.p1 GENE.GFYU01028473.1~~GFYU01028473.1.p1  ORF type:complete len:356 (-),score=98.84 GFYU01028473.1:106-1173(-)
MTQTDSFLHMLVEVSSAMAKVFLVWTVGYLAAKYPRNDPLLSATGVAYLSRLVFVMFLPMAIFVNVGAVSISMFGEVWALLVWNVLHLAIGYVGGLLCYWVTDSGIPRNMLILPLMYQNAIALPLLLMETIAPALFSPGDDERAVGFIFLYSIVFNMAMFSFGNKAFISSREDVEKENLNNETPSEFFKESGADIDPGIYPNLAVAGDVDDDSVTSTPRTFRSGADSTDAVGGTTNRSGSVDLTSIVDPVSGLATTLVISPASDGGAGVLRDIEAAVANQKPTTATIEGLVLSSESNPTADSDAANTSGRTVRLRDALIQKTGQYKKLLTQVFVNPPMIALACGLIVASIPELQS